MMNKVHIIMCKVVVVVDIQVGAATILILSPFHILLVLNLISPNLY